MRSFDVLLDDERTQLDAFGEEYRSPSGSSTVTPSLLSERPTGRPARRPGRRLPTCRWTPW